MAKAKKIMVTGASGYIGKHIVLQLLEAGYNVRGSVRSAKRGEEVRDAVSAHLKDAKDLDKRLEFVELDLTSDKGWDTALKGVDVLLHTASPFPLATPRDENELIRPAVDGTLRALKAAKAAGVTRVVLTSSSAAIYYGSNMVQGSVRTEEDWSDVNAKACGVYSKSKTLAERAAWDFVAENPQINLTTINPVLVTGPALDRRYGSSLELVERVLGGKDPMLPALKMDVVDVRDIAAMHVKSIDTKEASGKRFIGASESLWFYEIGQYLKSVYPNRKIATRRAPNFLISLMSLFDGTVKQVIPLLGVDVKVSSAQAQEILGIKFMPARESLKETAEYLLKG